MGVVGGGLGAVAAALAIAREGGQVTVLAPGEQLGGQMTRQGVSPLDEHALIETDGAAAGYRRLRDDIRARYRTQAPAGADPDVWRNPGNGWVSRLCFEPAVGAAVLEDMIAEHAQRITVLRGVEVVAVGRRGARISHLDVADPDRRWRVGIEVVIDATEDGRLLPLADAPWVIGAEARADTGEALAPDEADPARIQAMTVVAALRRDQVPGPIVPRPAGYERWRAAQPFRLDEPDARGRPRHFPMFEPTDGGPLPFWTYRRIRDAARLGGDELAVINWPGNDHHDRPSLGMDHAQVVDEARALTTAFVHWLQTEAPRDDGGHGHPELQPAGEVFGTPDGLAPEPYLREARRLRARTRIVAEDILPDPRRGARGRDHHDSGGVGWYPLDVHAAVGQPASRNDPTVPFQVPLSALVAERPDNLVVGGTAIGTTHLTNGAYRVHPVEWAIGEAAGALAVTAWRTGLRPGQVLDRPGTRLAVQRRLVQAGTPLAWVGGITPEDPRFEALQLLAIHGALGAPGLRGDLAVDLERTRDDRDRAVLRDAVERLRATLGHPAPLATTPRTLAGFAAAVHDLTHADPTRTDLTSPDGTVLLR
ncbi:MAG: FAD-dependent oxidoreductase [Nitriliruptoraceae bacterium]|nr:FAD-dependent oxidoreductase [Nitriliruptoraceae bacterium]